MSVENTTEKISYLDTSLPFEERVKDLIGRMTLEEKVGLTNHPAHGIPRRNISLPAGDRSFCGHRSGGPGQVCGVPRVREVLSLRRSEDQ